MAWAVGGTVGEEEKHTLCVRSHSCFRPPSLVERFSSGPQSGESVVAARTVLRRTLSLPVEKLGRKEYSDGTARVEWEPNMFLYHTMMRA